MNTKTSVQSIKNKQHFHLLDGLRGVAAIAIVIFHFCEWIIVDFKDNFIGHGYLAVDFFFCLSGFVIGYAYDNRIKKLGALKFFKARLIRLHPMIVVGTIIGLTGFLFDPLATNSSYSFYELTSLFLTSIMLIPMPIMKDRAFNNFGLNAPAWSLFWEYIANIGYALVLCKLGNKLLLLVTTIGAILLIMVGMRDGNLSGGWSNANFWVGGVRVLYSFSIGLLIYRSNWIIKNYLGFSAISILLFGAFLFPYLPKNGLYESIIVIFYFPLIVSLGAGSVFSKHKNKVCEFLGNLSYPLYMSHYAFIWIFSNYLQKIKPDSNQLIIIVSFGTVLLLAWAWLIMVRIDMPIRKYLSRKYL